MSRWVFFALTLLSFPALMSLFALTGSFAGQDPWRVLGWCLEVPLFVAMLMYWQWRWLYRKSGYLSGSVEGELSERGVTLRFPNARSDLSWKLFEKAVHSSDVVLLYQSPISFNILSREFFDSESDWKRAVELVDRHVSHARRHSA
jgi:hypothetical protein